MRSLKSAVSCAGVHGSRSDNSAMVAGFPVVDWKGGGELAIVVAGEVRARFLGGAI